MAHRPRYSQIVVRISLWLPAFHAPRVVTQCLKPVGSLLTKPFLKPISRHAVTLLLIDDAVSQIVNIGLSKLERMQRTHNFFEPGEDGEFTTEWVFSEKRSNTALSLFLPFFQYP